MRITKDIEHANSEQHKRLKKWSREKKKKKKRKKRIDVFCVGKKSPAESSIATQPNRASNIYLGSSTLIFLSAKRNLKKRIRSKYEKSIFPLSGGGGVLLEGTKGTFALV